jgi:hypothetical protein
MTTPDPAGRIAEQEETTITQLLAHRAALMRELEQYETLLEAIARVDAALAALNVPRDRAEEGEGKWDRAWGTFDAVRRYALATEGDLTVPGFLASPYATRWRTTTTGHLSRTRAASKGFTRLAERGVLTLVKRSKPNVYRRTRRPAGEDG